ncbi:MAG: dihydroorotate dehydrogenase electron transfer subunit [Calditrichaeota bacterium]|nr:MAG: dihydroorotate dehydrogenase electron transfer subunit [Calditrichota bacterium]
MIKPTADDALLVRKRDLKNNYYSITFKPFTSAKKCKPGHFIQLQIPKTDIFFRRPMSIASVSSDGDIEVIFNVVGRGTKLLANLEKNDTVNILGPLGSSFSNPKKNEEVVIIAGGVGFPPLMYFATELVKSKFPAKQIHFFYGGRSKDDILEKSRIKKLGLNFYPITEDGTFGEKGLVTKPVERFINENEKSKLRIYSCGPTGMLKAANEIGKKYNIPGELSLEAPMPCGVGICLGCIVELEKGGHARVCAEGPVFQIGEVKL